jgi:hypothetical protein
VGITGVPKCSLRRPASTIRTGHGREAQTEQGEKRRIRWVSVRDRSTGTASGTGICARDEIGCRPARGGGEGERRKRKEEEFVSVARRARRRRCPAARPSTHISLSPKRKWFFYLSVPYRGLLIVCWWSIVNLRLTRHLQYFAYYYPCLGFDVILEWGNCSGES